MTFVLYLSHLEGFLLREHRLYYQHDITTRLADYSFARDWSRLFTKLLAGMRSNAMPKGILGIDSHSLRIFSPSFRSPRAQATLSRPLLSHNKVDVPM